MRILEIFKLLNIYFILLLCQISNASTLVKSPSAQLIRSLKLVNAVGTQKTVSDVIGKDGKGIVIFLRHLA